MAVTAQSISEPTPVAKPDVPAQATIHRDLAYVPEGHERQRLDLYLPANLPSKGEGPFPTLVWIHGGAWQSGSKDNCPATQLSLLQHGFALASINYRLSDQAQFPAQLHDCKAAIRWLRAHAQTYLLDPGRIGVSGASAGGHLAALLGTTGNTRAFDIGPNLDQSSQVHAVCDFFGPSDFAAFASVPEYREHGDSPVVQLLGGTVWEKPELARDASPTRWITAETPPFLIFHGDSDPVVPISQSQLLYEALKAQGLAVEFHTVIGAAHGQGFGSPEIGRRVSAFFAEALKPSASRWVVKKRNEAKTSQSRASG